MKEHDADLRSPQFSFGLFKYKQAQRQFLLAIQEHVPSALVILKNSVLPLWNGAQRDSSEGWGLGRETFDALHLPELPEFFNFHPESAKLVSSAIWDWAAQLRLVESSDVPGLKEIVSLFDHGRVYAEHCSRYSPFYHEHLSSGLITSENASPNTSPRFGADSSTFLFGLLTLFEVVRLTLEAWRSSPPADKLLWVFPPDDGPPFSSFNDDAFSKLTLTPEILKSDWPSYTAFVEEHFLPTPIAYTFTPVRAWNIFNESFGAAKRRIKANLEAQLDQQMSQHEKHARRQGIAKRGRILKPDQFMWLAKFQVDGDSAYKLAKKNSAREKKIRGKIYSAAALVAGPRWESWIRTGQEDSLRGQ